MSINFSGANLTSSKWTCIHGNQQVLVSYTATKDALVPGDICEIKSSNLVLFVVNNNTMVSLPTNTTAALEALNSLQGEKEFNKMNTGPLHIKVKYNNISVRVPIQCFVPILSHRMGSPCFRFKVTDHLNILMQMTEDCLSPKLYEQVNAFIDNALTTLVDDSHKNDSLVSKDSLMSKINVLKVHERRFIPTRSKEKAVIEIINVEIVDVANFATQQKAIIYFKNTSADIKVGPFFEICCGAYVYDFVFKGRRDGDLWAITSQLVQKSQFEHIMQYLRSNPLWKPKSDSEQSSRLNPEAITFKLTKICTWLGINVNLDAKSQVSRAYQALNIIEPDDLRTSVKVEKLFAICQDNAKSFADKDSLESFRKRTRDAKNDKNNEYTTSKKHKK